VGLETDLERIAALAKEHAPGDPLVAVLATEAQEGSRRYLCAFEHDGARSWLLLDATGGPVTSARAVRESVAIAALCELAEESAFPGDLDELRAQLVALRVAESPPGIEEAEAAALALQHALGAPPTVASPGRLDGIGMAARRLERALDPAVTSPFGAVMQSAQGVVDELVREVETGYRMTLQVP
jgi:hypothetical protein